IQTLGPVLDANDIADSHQITWHVDALTVHRHVAVTNQLAGRRAAETEAEPVNDIIEAAFQQAHEHIARVALGSLGLLEVPAELSLEHAVIMLHLLLLAQMNAVVGQLAAPRLLLPWGRIPPLNATLRRIAPRALEKQLHP